MLMRDSFTSCLHLVQSFFFLSWVAFFIDSFVLPSLSRSRKSGLE